MSLPSNAEANRRDEVLRVAAQLFARKGFHATTTRDIAEAAGMRSGSPFYHFRSKQEMLKTAIIEGVAAGQLRIEAALAGCIDPEQRLRTLIRTHLGNLLESGCDVPLLLYEWQALDASERTEVACATDRYQQVWQDTLDQLVAARRIPQGHATRLWLFGMLNWSSQWYRPDGGCSLDQLANEAADLLLRPSAAPSPPP